MRGRSALVVFWTAVLVTVFTLGIAWSAWKTTNTSALALLIAVPASVMSVVSALVAARVLTLVTRAHNNRR